MTTCDSSIRTVFSISYTSKRQMAGLSASNWNVLLERKWLAGRHYGSATLARLDLDLEADGAHMPDGDKLILGELQNAATSMTRLVGSVDGNTVFRSWSCVVCNRAGLFLFPDSTPHLVSEICKALGEFIAAGKR